MTVRADVHITDTTTGETRIYRNIEPWEDADGSMSFLWAEGNFAGDGNRALFFAWAAGEDRDDADCDDYGERFFVRILNRDTGDVLYEDDADDSPLIAIDADHVIIVCVGAPSCDYDGSGDVEARMSSCRLCQRVIGREAPPIETAH